MKTSTVAALLRLSSVRGNDRGAWLEEILRIDAEVLAVERVSYWTIRDDPPCIFCVLCYVAHTGIFERGALVLERNSPAFFDQVRNLQLIDAANAREDPRTSDLGTYLQATNVGAILDVPVCALGKPAGVLCHEHVGGSRSWTDGEQEFAVAVSQVVVARLEEDRRSRSEAAERRASFLAEVAPALAEPLDVDEIAEIAVRRALPLFGDVANLVAFDEGSIRLRAAAHVTPEGQRILDEWKRQYPPSLDGPQFVSQAIHEKQSLILPIVTPRALASFVVPGAAALVTALKIRSVLAVPLLFRRKITGALSFMSSSRTYTEDDLRFAESYARQVGGVLENARLYQEAQEAIRVRDEFVSLASHELRTPLTALRASAESITREVRKGSISSEVVMSKAETVARQVEKLVHLSEQILDASQIVDRPSLRLQRMDLAEVVRTVGKGLARRAERAGSRLTVNAEAPAVGQWDRSQLEKMVSNLLDNAIKFGAGQPIEVTVRTDGGRMLLTVRDRGIGISGEHLESIFQRYSRGVSAKNFGGLGLGLYLVRVIAEAHGGTVRAESCPGAGATFTVELPLPQPAVAPALVPRASA